MAAEMRAMGASEDAVQAFIDASAEDDDDDRDDDDERDSIDAASDDRDDVEPWPENQETVDVFYRCAWTRQAVNRGEAVKMLWDGISSGEVASVCGLMAIPPSRQPDVLLGVRIMVGAALPLLNAD